MIPKLANDVEQAVAENHGVFQVEGQRASYVVLSLDAFRELIGVGSDVEMAESLRAVEEGLADIESGRTRPFRDVLAELG